MASALTKIGPCWPSIFKRAYFHQTWPNLHSITKSFYSSQLPTPGEPGWKGFVDNVQKFQMRPSLSPAELAHGQEVIEVKHACEKMEKKFEEVITSNTVLKGDLQRLI